jgi:hypothetical protein
MKTAMQEFIDEMKEYNMILVKEGIQPNPLIYMFQHKAKKLLEKEKEQIINAYDMGKTTIKFVEEAEEYYNQIYNN